MPWAAPVTTAMRPCNSMGYSELEAGGKVVAVYPGDMLLKA